MASIDPGFRKAFVVRVAPGGQRLLDQCLAKSEIVIGWDDARGLSVEQDWERFRNIVAKAHYPEETSLRKAGSAAGHLWRFIRDMSFGDVVIVPASAGQFYIAEISGSAKEIGAGGVGYSRPVEWLNMGHPIDRSLASARLQSRMKVYGSTAGASDLLGEIDAVLADALSVRNGGTAPTFESDLRTMLVNATLAQMREGKVDSYKFERIVQAVLMNLGATEVSITARRSDEGDDIVADFQAVGGLVEIKVCVQVKHYYQVSPPLGKAVVDEVISGMRKVDADFGIIATVGSVSEEASQYAEQLADEGDRIVLLDGEQLAALYLDHCVSAAQCRG